MRVLIATRNPGKARELAALLEDEPVQIVSLADFPSVPETVEDGETMAANAAKKAQEGSLATGLLTVADDSGLEVDALDGAPGVRSSRFLGRGSTEEERNTEILRRMREVPDERRTCRFRCAVAVARDGRIEGATEGTCEGRIAHVPRGNHGFGYDPIFYLPDRGCTMAELEPQEKNEISHRGRALREAASILRRQLAG
jgi:XTP/dITP diphosphohydrolase